MILYLLTTTLLLPLDPPPTAEPKLVPATRNEVKEALETHKGARPRLPMPPADPTAARTVNNGRFRNCYLGKDLSGGTGGREPDPAMTLDPTFKVKLFWVTSRANNCYYCLGHQEHKLAAAGVGDDDIAKLDGDTTELPAAEASAVEFTRKLTFAPHALTQADFDALAAHYTPAQVAEIVVTVAGYNATNRWTDGLNIPADADGEFFRKGSKGDKALDLSTFRTPTSPKFAALAPKGAAPLPEACAKASAPSWPARPALEDRPALEAALAEARTRTPRLPLATCRGRARTRPATARRPGVGALSRRVPRRHEVPRPGHHRLRGEGQTVPAPEGVDRLRLRPRGPGRTTPSTRPRGGSGRSAFPTPTSTG